MSEFSALLMVFAEKHDVWSFLNAANPLSYLGIGCRWLAADGGYHANALALNFQALTAALNFPSIANASITLAPILQDVPRMDIS